MAKEARDISKAIGFVSVDCGVIITERLFEAFVPNPVEFAEPLADKTVECGIGAFLGATLDDHVAKLDLQNDVRNPFSSQLGELRTSSPSFIWTFSNLWTASS